MILWASLCLGLVLVVAVVVIAVCAVRACRILWRISAVVNKLHLQVSNLLGMMPRDWNFTEWDWGNKRGR